MPDIVTFNPFSFPPIITEIDSGQAINTITVQEIYSEWKDWVLADSSRLGFPPAFSVIGGDEITDTRDLGSTFFLQSPWKIRPAEYSHTLVVEGNLYTSPAGVSPYVTTLGSYTVNIESTVSNIIDLLNTFSPADLSIILNTIEDWGVIASSS